jgi:Type III restriction enzyme, res subunit
MHLPERQNSHRRKGYSILARISLLLVPQGDASLLQLFESRCTFSIILNTSVSAPDHKLIVMRCAWRQSLFIRRARSRNASSLSPVVLRPYQEHCLDACADALRSGVSRIGVSLPTGSGKTTVFISLLSRISCPASNPVAQRSLIVVNSIELARQSAMQVAHLFPTWSVEIEQGSKHKASGNADV